MLASRWAPTSEREHASEEMAEGRAVDDKANVVSNSDSKHEVDPEQTKSPRPEIGRTASTESSHSQVQRTKKKVAWKGRQCLIWLPAGPPEHFGGVRPMSGDELRQRIKDWEMAGFDTSGFDLEHTGHSQTDRGLEYLHCSETEQLFAPEQGALRAVKIPDPKAWKNYVDWVTEEKLRALGVGGFDDPPVSSAREVNPQPAVRNFSPSFTPVVPGLPSFPISQRSTPGLSNFSTGTHSRTMSIASPISSGSEFRGHAHRHSVFGMPQAYAQAPSFNPSMRSFSPSQQLSLNSIARANSPSLDRLKNSISPVPRVISPVDGQPLRPSPLSGERRWTPPMHTRHQSMMPSFSPQLMPTNETPYQPLAEVPEEHEESTPHFTPQDQDVPSQIVIPTPRGHRHNISHNLEKEIRDAEQLLEQQVTSDNPVQRIPTPSFVGGVNMPSSDSFSFKPTQQAPGAAAFQFGGPAPQIQFHSQGFGFQPQNTFGQNSLNPVGSFFQPHAPAFNPSHGVPSFQPGQHTTHKPRPSQAFATSNLHELDVSAPSFQPQGFGGFSGGLTSSNFEFSSSHTFQPGASTFEPARPVDAHQVEGSIFGKAQIPDVVKPARRSKAIEIIKPVSSPANDLEEEDESGRLVQSTERQKRAFRGADDEGNSVPLFAARPQSPIGNPQSHNEKGDMVVEAPALEDSFVDHESKDDSLLDHEPSSKPAPQHDQSEAPSKDDLLLDEDDDSEQDQSEGISAPNPRRHARNPSSLSALAKPFTFNASSHSVPEPVLRMPTFDFNPSANVNNMLDPEQPDFSPAKIFSRDALNVEGGMAGSPEPMKLAASPLQDPTTPQLAEISFEPSFDEIDAVMRQLNEETEPMEGSEGDFNVESLSADNLEDSAIASRVSSPRSVQIHAVNMDHSRSPSPLPTDICLDTSRDGIQVPNSSNLRPSSEWSEDFTSGAGARVRQRSDFFDDRVDQIIGKAFRAHIRPLQEQVVSLQQQLTKANYAGSTSHSRRIVSSGMESDADDEDDIIDSKFLHRPVSSGRARKFELLKAAMMDALASQNDSTAETMGHGSLRKELESVNMRLDSLLTRDIDHNDIRDAIEETLHKTHAALVHVPRPESAESDRSEGFNSKKLLQLAEEELDVLRAANSDKDSQLRHFERDRRDLRDRLEDAESAESRLQQKLSDLAAENAAQNLTLEEYRASRMKWKQDQEDASDEQRRLCATILELEGQVADGINVRDNMREKLDRIHSDMAIAAEQLASQKVVWHRQHEDLLKRCAVFQARLDSEIQLRSGLEIEVSRLRGLASQGEIAQAQLEQSIKNNGVLEESIQQLRDEVTDRQTSNSRIHRELQDARENSRIEVQRAQLMMQAAVESANSHADAARAGLESKLSITTNELENIKALMDAMKARHDVLLQEEADLRRDTLFKVNEASNAALDGLKTRHQEDIHFMKEQHTRTLAEAKQDRERSDSFWNERLSLSEARHGHLQERISHLEERLEIAKSAAQAAALAAQSAKAAPRTIGASFPERISPQALRESILVLQEQLQERESRIEGLQAQMSDVEDALPAKLKEKEIEISWLRELLAVRSEDLNELIDNLSQPSFDQQAAKDTAIRIRTALQMEQAEKERHIAAGSSLPAQAVASLTNFASPKAAQLAAAFGNWRARGTPSGPTPSSLRNAQLSQLMRSNGTPLKRPASSASWMSGLMTPPASNLRRTPSPHSPSVAAQANAAKRPDSRGSQTSSQATQKRTTLMHSSVPATPDDTPFSFRHASYDEDATLGPLGLRIDDDLDALDIASPVPISHIGSRSLATELEPLG